MNEFAAKKLGEVLAFCNSGVVILERGQEALQGLLGYEYSQIVSSLKEQSQKITSFSTELGMSEVTSTKAEKTGAKLISMAEMYIGDEWDNQAELLEWFGFFEGAAVIHWRLVFGVSEGLKSEPLQTLANTNIELHTNLLNKFGDFIEKYAVDKTTA